MSNSIAKIHHITQSGLDTNELTQIKNLCESGGEWTQLRIKNIPYETFLAIAKEARELTSFYGVKLIINDYPEIAAEIAADGVHLGQEDMETNKTRRIVGRKMIIGRTCNTLDHILDVAEDEIDYIGLGPLRFTSTKENLSPVLGIEGYRQIIQNCHKHKIFLPIIAIGGIEVTDLKDLTRAGVHGIALASALNTAPSMKNAIDTFKNEF